MLLEQEVDTCLDLMTIRLGGVGVIDVQQIVVVAHGEHDVTSLEAKTAAQIDVETIGVSVIGIVVVVSLAIINMDGADINGPKCHTGKRVRRRSGERDHGRIRRNRSDSRGC